MADKLIKELINGYQALWLPSLSSRHTYIRGAPRRTYLDKDFYYLL